MEAAVKIVSLELENVKRVRAVAMTPAATGLTVIGGDNCQGKTSILDGICYALGGERYRPTNLQREDGQATARMDIHLSNGLRVERKGKNAALTVTDISGARQGQRLLDSFIEELALDLPKFVRASGKEKATVLLRILGIEDQLAALDREEKSAFDERTAQGRIASQKKAFAEGLPEHHDVPEAPVSASDLMAEVQAVAARNAERTAAGANVAKLVAHATRCQERMAATQRTVDDLTARLSEARAALGSQTEEWEMAKTAASLNSDTPIPPDESTADIEARMAELEFTNAKVRANLDKRKALDDAQAAMDAHEHLTAKVEAVRARRDALLASVELPLPGLSVTDGELTLNGKAWDCMSSAEQVRAAVAIVRCLKPECGFVLLDGMETFDAQQLADFGAWLQSQNLQAIATRVSKGGECSIVIEDGLVAGAPDEVPAASEATPATVQDW